MQAILSMQVHTHVVGFWLKPGYAQGLQAFTQAFFAASQVPFSSLHFFFAMQEHSEAAKPKSEEKQFL